MFRSDDSSDTNFSFDTSYFFNNAPDSSISMTISDKKLETDQKLQLIDDLLNKIKNSITSETWHEWCRIAITEGEDEILKLFVERYKVDVNFAPDDSWPLLHIAVYNDRLSAVKILIQNKAIPRPLSHVAGYGPYHIAVARGNLSIVQFFVDEKIHPIDFPATELPPIGESRYISSYPLEIAASNGQLHVVRYFLENGITYEPLPDRWDAIHSAALRGHLDILKLLVKTFKVKIDLVDAVSYRRETRRYLSHRKEFLDLTGKKNIRDIRVGQTGIRITREKQSTLNLAAENGHLPVIQFLDEIGAPYLANKDGRLPIHTAAANGHMEVVRFFVEQQKRDINSRVKNSLDTPLHLVVIEASGPISRERKRLIEYLAMRISKHSKNAKGETPLKCALNRWAISLTRLFRDDSADDSWIDVVVTLFDFKQFTRLQDFLIVINSASVARRFNLITCMLARSDDFEKEFNTLMGKFNEGMQKGMPLAVERANVDQIQKLKNEFSTLVNDLKSFIPEDKALSPFLNLQRIETAMRVGGDFNSVALACKKFQLPASSSDLTKRTLPSDLINHILSFLIAPEVGAEPDTIIEVMQSPLQRKKKAAAPVASGEYLPTLGLFSFESFLVHESPFMLSLENKSDGIPFFQSQRFKFYRKVAASNEQLLSTETKVENFGESSAKTKTSGEVTFRSGEDMQPPNRKRHNPGP